MTSKSTCLVADPIFTEHLTAYDHPESPLRYVSIMESLKTLGLPVISPREASEEEIALCHTSAYLRTVINDVAECERIGIVDGSLCLSTGDVQICPATYRVALRAVGGVLDAVDAVMRGNAKNAFCVVRPPGHHACSNEGMGFCVFNNVAIGARYCQRKYGIGKVLIVDWDVHHGNGTQEIFYSDPSVFYFSTHQWPLYPGTGAEEERGDGKAAGTKLNCPIWATKEARNEIFRAFREKLVPAMREFKPEFVYISAGFDAHVSDPLGSLNLTDEDFAELTYIVTDIANVYAQERVVSVLEGGYNLQALASAAKAHVAALTRSGL